jgi:3-hydroxyisobutyrate dehydrogenase-like beta-hydroxyacid dehydrogenase
VRDQVGSIGWFNGQTRYCLPMIGVLHPGDMGAVIGRVLVDSGGQVGWAGTGRSPATRTRAAESGLVDLQTVERIKNECAVVLSVCPPHAAMEMAQAIAGYDGVYVDANAVSPVTSRAVGEIVTAGGARYVDGGIVGPPPRRQGTTRLFLAGAAATEVAALFAGTAVEARVLGPEHGAASALKMVYAAWTKGTTAMLVALRATARRLDVETELLDEWAKSQPDLPQRSEQAARVGLERGWRWAFELEEVGRTFADAGLPDGFGAAAAAVFHRLTDTAGDELDPDLERAMALLARDA